MNRLIIQKSFLYLLLSVAVSHLAKAQAPVNASTYRSGLDTNRLGDIREKLVLLALQNPGYEIADRHVNVADYQLRKAKGSWLNLFSASGNLNELSINKKLQTQQAQAGGSVFYPKYNFNVTLPLDFLTQKSNDVKIAREQVYIAEAEKNERYRLIRKEVLTKYEDYVMNKEKLEIQSRITQSEYTKYKLAEKDFEDNLITAEVFNRAEALYLQQQLSKSEMQRNYNVVKLELEQMIGVSINEVLNKK